MSLSHLPIDAVLPALTQSLKQTSRLVLRAPPGAGKTTRVPPAILNEYSDMKGRIVMLQPRRLAARTAARRIAEEQGWSLGAQVGYRVRFDSLAGGQTRILVVTEGILLRQLMDDPFLEGTSVVIFDEFHERNLYSDVALAMIRRIQQTVRDDLKIVVMSATMDPEPIAAYLDQSPVIDSPGKTFPVDIRYVRGGDRRRLEEKVVDGVHDLLDRTTGDLLVFLPGVGEIHRAARQLGEAGISRQADILHLYGDLPSEDQDRIMRPGDRRRIILSTNVAETSVTIPGVTGVVDTGLAKVLRFDPQVGLDRLELESISKASADQRAGRAGRTQPGVCLRLWEETGHRARPEQTEPEIRRVDLTGPILQLLSWGERDLDAFCWFERPRADSVQRALRLLRQLGAIDARHQVTVEGHLLSRLPVPPRVGKLILAGQRLGIADDAAWVAAMLSERDPFFRGKSSAQGRDPRTVVSRRSHSDVVDRLASLKEAERAGTSEFPWGTLNRSAARFIQKSRDQLLRLVGATRSTTSLTGDPEEALQRALLAAFPDRVVKRRDVGSDRGLMVGGQGVRLAPQSAVRSEEFFLGIEIDAGGSGDAIVRIASAIDRDWLPDSLLDEREELFFHPSQKQVMARHRSYYEDLLLSETPASISDTDAAAELLLTEANKAWNQILPRDEAFANWIIRLTCLSEWHPALELPASAEDLKREVLRSLCQRCRSFAELKRADWLSELQGILPWDAWQKIQQLAPEKIRVPSGSEILLVYESGRPPVLPVRIQEMFGLLQTPTIVEGKVPVLLHLLAPNLRPQQVTDDLASFWKNTYPEVRKELARRYPKHPWPEDPVSAKPIRK
ncbi:MAG: ATP-dependent helicase HrpB [Planctomycetaceae bacterium]|nr:ATP-dependent helicase HrpB [Planctomycetaceae bacterium]